MSSRPTRSHPLLLPWKHATTDQSYGDQDYSWRPGLRIITLAITVNWRTRSAPWECRHHISRAIGIPTSYLSLAGSVYIAPVVGSTHGHILFPKKPGFEVRYIEFGIVKPPGVLCHR